jgi:hypothetical protein
MLAADPCLAKVRAAPYTTDGGDAVLESLPGRISLPFSFWNSIRLHD